MFFDNLTMYNFLYKVREAGIQVPILAGIMPITNEKQVGRSVALSGATIPQKFKRMIDSFGDDPARMRQAGIIYASEQIIDLISNGVSHIHVYTMNKPDVAAHRRSSEGSAERKSGDIWATAGSGRTAG